METDWAPICDRYLNMQPEVGLVCRRREVKVTSTPNGGLESMDPLGSWWIPWLFSPILIIISLEYVSTLLKEGRTE